MKRINIMKMRKCPNCKIYTFKEKCPKCGAYTVFPNPPKFSPLDKYGKLRRNLKRMKDGIFPLSSKEDL
jgi:H/ACA ribonucleoprotein complex subunit 3